jgi:ankyrin repeat protein
MGGSMGTDGGYAIGKSSGRMTPKDDLLYEAMNGNADKVKKLLEQHADVNKQDEDGWTALMWAANRGHFDVIKLLVEHGADVAIKNKTGKTSVELAKLGGYNDIAEYLDSIMRMRDEITNRATDDKGINNKLKPELSNTLRSR